VSEPSDYDRGVTAGGVQQQLANHDQHFKVINGSIVDGKNATMELKEEIHELRLAIQRLADQAIARDATVVTTAAALKDAEEARRNTADQRWSPWQKAFAVIAAIGVLVGVYFALRGLA